MQQFIRILVFTFGILYLLPQSFATPGTGNDFNLSMNQCLNELEQEINIIRGGFRLKKFEFQNHISKLNFIIANSRRKRKIFNAIIKREALNDSLRSLILREEIEVSKVRYLKGIQIIKILYDRILALDHHYTSLNTIQSIQRMSNPNNYPLYINTRERIVKHNPKRSGFDLSGILADNLHTNIMYSILSLFSSTSFGRKNKQDELKNMECIIDFTLRLNGDLNTIHYEMQFLKHFNEESKTELERLFEVYLSPLNYLHTLEESKTNDLWQSIDDLVENHTDSIKMQIGDSHRLLIRHEEIDDLKFSIDQLYFFIHRYRTQTTQSVNFYRKFKIMLDSYDNAEICSDQIPEDFLRLKANIDLTITKFQKAYSLGELRGSKLKQLLYGGSSLN